jgi:RNA exonuclease 1
MCDTADGPELTRISLLDSNGCTLLDALVKPYSPVIDYKEKYSGINASMLENVTIRLEQIQIAFLRLVTSNTILVGHALENDLKALRVCHYRCLDTSVLYPHPRGYPYRNKLKTLAKEYLGIQIQRGGNGLAMSQLGPSIHASSQSSPVCGHSSVEDANAAIQLAKLKVDMGPSFGLKAGAALHREPLTSHLSPFVTHSSFILGGQELLQPIRPAVGATCEVSVVSSTSDAIETACRRLVKYSQLPTASEQRNFMYIGLKLTGGDDNDVLNQVLEPLVKTLHQIKASPRHTLLIVTGQHSIQKVFDLQRRKGACMKALSASVWTEQLEDELAQTIRDTAIVKGMVSVI